MKNIDSLEPDFKEKIQELVEEVDRAVGVIVGHQLNSLLSSAGVPSA